MFDSFKVRFWCGQGHAKILAWSFKKNAFSLPHDIQAGRNYIIGYMSKKQFAIKNKCVHTLQNISNEVTYISKHIIAPLNISSTVRSDLL